MKLNIIRIINTNKYTIDIKMTNIQSTGLNRKTIDKFYTSDVIVN